MSSYTMHPKDLCRVFKLVSPESVHRNSGGQIVFTKIQNFDHMAYVA